MGLNAICNSCFFHEFILSFKAQRHLMRMVQHFYIHACYIGNNSTCFEFITIMEILLEYIFFNVMKNFNFFLKISHYVYKENKIG